jgi:hypothetical protein
VILGFAAYSMFLMVYGQRNEAPPADLISNIARDMAVSVDEAITKINAVSAGTSAQFTVLAKSMGLNPVAAQAWIADHRKDTAMAAAQAHFLRRDLKAWEPLLNDYRDATGDGRSH